MKPFWKQQSSPEGEPEPGEDLSAPQKKRKGIRRPAAVRTWAGRVLFLLGPFINLLMVEVLNERNPFTNLNAEEWALNLALYVLLYAVLWLILGRKRRAAAAVTLFCFVFGLVNHYVIRFRGKILFPQDILSWQTAANVATNYDYTPDAWMWGALAICMIYLLLVWLVIAPEKQRGGFPKQRHIPEVLLGVASAAYVYAFFFSPWLPTVGMNTQQWKTQSNGFLLNFSIALRYSAVEEPEDYSTENLLSLIASRDGVEVDTMEPVTDTNVSSSLTAEAQDYDSDPDETITPTNIICIMDETFTDLSIFERLETNEDACAFYHSLQENTIKGWMYSPVTGGGTATVEYEFLTGNSYTFLPEGTVAYSLYLKDGQPSLCSWAETLGYTTTAFHPYYSSGWNRPMVYTYMGFDQQIYTTDLTNKRFVRGYVSDAFDFQTVEELTAEQNANGQKCFVFNVTIQNHGGYAQSWSNLKREIEPSEALAGEDDTTAQFLNLMNATDEALEELISYYSSIDEPTIICFFGDHQGKIDTEVYEELYGKELDDRTVEEVELQYVTPFFIWANYDIEEAQDVMISTNYLGVLMAMQTNLPLSGYQQFLAELYEELPVINPIAYIDADGNVIENEEDLTEKQQEYLSVYENFSYYSLFKRDGDSTVDEFFFYCGALKNAED